eukprot:570976-Amphidinium_carterae.1
MIGSLYVWSAAIIHFQVCELIRKKDRSLDTPDICHCEFAKCCQIVPKSIYTTHHHSLILKAYTQTHTRIHVSPCNEPYAFMHTRIVRASILQTNTHNDCLRECRVTITVDTNAAQRLEPRRAPGPIVHLNPRTRMDPLRGPPLAAARWSLHSKQ